MLVLYNSMSTIPLDSTSVSVEVWFWGSHGGGPPEQPPPGETKAHHNRDLQRDPNRNLPFWEWLLVNVPPHIRC